VQQRVLLPGVRAMLAQQPQQRLARHARQVAPPLQRITLWRKSDWAACVRQPTHPKPKTFLPSDL
jgi:hypothetical protein